MRLNRFVRLLQLAMLFPLVVGWPVEAATLCTAGNANTTSVIESTPTSAFTDHGDGTVTHVLTGLMWKQCALGQSGADCSATTATALIWSDALAAAVADTTAGHTDWRLPNKKELESIVEFCGYNPSINQTVFPTPVTSLFWSGTSYVPDPTKAWAVSFAVNSTLSDSKAFHNYVRLVRGGPPLDSFDFLNTAPTASSLNVTGTAQFGQVLTGSYVYADVDSDAEDTSGSGSSYRFVRSTDNSVASTGDNVDAATGNTGGVNQTYSAQAADVGKYLFYCATPRASSGNSPGTESCSSATSAVGLAVQTITGFAPTTPVVSGAAAATLSATGGGSGNPIVFATTSVSSICTVSGTQVTFVGIGVCNLTANQAAGGSYSAAPQVTAGITINAAVQTITGFAPTTPVLFGAAAATLSATGGGSGSPIVFATTSVSSICTVSGTQVTFVGIGVCNLTANQAAGGNYGAAQQVTTSITINASQGNGAIGIPTLSEWALIMLSGLLLLLGLAQTRRWRDYKCLTCCWWPSTRRLRVPPGTT